MTPAHSSSPCKDDESVKSMTVEDYANFFFSADYDNMSTGSSVQSLAMMHHQWQSKSEQRPSLKTASASHPPQNKRKRRRVSFKSTPPTVHKLNTFPPSSKMTSLEKSTTWLQTSDIEELQASAHSCIQAMRNRVAPNAHVYKYRTKFRALMLAMEKETGSSVRGLEHKVYRRKELRRMLIRDVIECQQHIDGLARFGHVISADEKRRLLANASMEKSVYFVKKALLDAKDDYEEVYSSSCGGGISSPLSTPAEVKVRRVSSDPTSIASVVKTL